MNQNELVPTLVPKKAAEFFGEAGEFRCLSLDVVMGTGASRERSTPAGTRSCFYALTFRRRLGR